MHRACFTECRIRCNNNCSKCALKQTRGFDRTNQCFIYKWWMVAWVHEWNIWLAKSLNYEYLVLLLVNVTADKAGKGSITASIQPQKTGSMAQTIGNYQLHNWNRLLWGPETWRTRFPQPTAGDLHRAKAHKSDHFAMADLWIYREIMHKLTLLGQSDHCYRKVVKPTSQQPISRGF